MNTIIQPGEVGTMIVPPAFFCLMTGVHHAFVTADNRWCLTYTDGEKEYAKVEIPEPARQDFFSIVSIVQQTARKTITV